ncbi:filamin-C-like isoform X2 [Branchiostoma lanceolatum]|uniref:filamin-C-like isoform X2 n=1 Tax=Branchiostoma lanceolatum TaxID=7740 RepID=UPI003455C010
MSSTAVVGEYYLKDPNDDRRVKVGTYSDTSYDPSPTKAGFFTDGSHRESMGDSHRGSVSTSHRGSISTSHRGSVRSSRRESVRSSHRESVRSSHRGSMSNGYANGDSFRRDSRPNVPFVSGDGVNQARVDRPAAVKVLPYGMVGDYFTVETQGPYDHTAQTLDLSKERDGQIIGNYTPDNIGPWTVSVKHEGDHIPNSPFTCEVYDPTQVEVNDLHDDILGKLVKFSVNTAKAGNGDLTVHVNGPDGRRVRSKIEDVGPHNYNVSFSPDTTGNHKVEVEFNNDEVNGSPFDCYISEPELVEAEESHSVFAVHHDHDHDDHDHHHHDHDHHHHHDHHDAPATYTVTESRVLEPPKREVIVTAIHGAVVDRPAGFLVDATRAGGGDFDITITNNEHPVPYQVVGEREPGVFEVTFLPKEAGTYRIDVFYDGQPVRGSPFYVRIQDSADIEHYIYVPSKTTVYQEVEVEQPRYSVVEETRVHRPPSPVYRTPTPPPVVYRARTPPPVVYRAPTPPPVVYRAPTPPPVVYRAPTPPPVVYSAPPQQISYQQSPAVNDRCYAHGEKLHTAFKDRHAEFPIRTEDSMNMKEMDVQILGPTTRALASLEKDADTTANVRFVPTETGRFDTSIKYYGKEAEGNPFSFTVVDPNSITCVYPPVGADRSFTWPVDDPCKVTLDTSKAGSGRLGTKVMDPLGSSIPTNFDQDNAFQFTPRMEGRHPINLEWDGADLAPIYCDAYYNRDRPRTPPSPAKQSYEVILKGTGLQRAMVDETAEFTIDGSRAGGGTPACSVTGPEGPVDVYLQPLDSQGDMYKARYTPKVPGVHDLDVAWSGRPLEGSPYKVQVEGGARRDASKVELGGLDRDPVLVGEPAYLTADLRDAGQGGILSARCKGPTQKAKVNMLDNGNGTYNLEVIPREEGKHRMDVRYDDQKVKGSPFSFYAVGPVDPGKVRCFGPGLESGNLSGYRGNFVCETKGAGHGKLQVRVHGPKGGFNVRMTPIKDSGNRTIAVEYEPKEPGDYHIDVTWDKQHVPGSPFFVRIDDDSQSIHDRDGDYGYHSAPVLRSESARRSRSASQRSRGQVRYPNYGYALPGNYREKESIYGRRIEREGPISTYY